MIEIKNLSFSYGDEEVLHDLSLTVPDRGITAIIAPSGHGKTTLLRLLTGLEETKVGTITGVPNKVSYVFQEDRLLPWFSALDNLLAVDPEGSEAEASELLFEFGIVPELQRKTPEELSGGQRRRVCIARALFYGGDLLILDEPFTGLDVSSRDLVLTRIREYAMGRSVILVSHIKEDIEIADLTIEI